MKRRIASLIVVPVIALLVAALPALAAPELAVTPPSGQPGDELTAFAVGFTPGSTITFLWNAQPDAVLGTAVADEAGTAVLTFPIPADETAGAAVVRACAGTLGCPPGAEFADAAIDVLPRSLLDGDQAGGGWLPLLIIALVALSLGALTATRLSRTRETFKPVPPKKHDHEFEGPPEVGRPSWKDREE
jgi:hypothetical protein